MKASYEFYTKEFCGRVPQSDFLRLSVKAAAYLTQLTAGRVNAALPAAMADSVQYALCEVIDAMAENETAEIASESNDGASVSYKREVSSAQRLYNAAALHLASTGLLYRGCG